MRENRTYGSEGGEAKSLPYPLSVVIVAVAPRYSYSCPSSVSPPETSTLPGAGSRLNFLTTPSSTSIE